MLDRLLAVKHIDRMLSIMPRHESPTRLQADGAFFFWRGGDRLAVKDAGGTSPIRTWLPAPNQWDRPGCSRDGP
jgi:hypothetical protein